jgi:zinc protease
MKIWNVALMALLILFTACASVKDMVPAYQPQPVKSTTPVMLPPITEKILPNGLKVIVLEHHELPVVNFSMTIGSGASCEPAEFSGLASCTASLLNRGTATRSASDIASAIDFVGGSLGASANFDYARVNCQVLKKHFSIGLELFADIILHPTFQDKEIERYRKNTISGYIEGKNDPSNLADEYFDKALFGENRYGYPVSGTDVTLSKIQRSDILSFYHDYYLPNNSFLIVSGDVRSEEIVSAVEERFASWNTGDLKAPAKSTFPPLSGVKILLLDRSDATQAQIRLGHYGVPRNNPDFFNISLMNYILGGGGFSSRLMKEVRSKMGLTYGIDSGFDMRKDMGVFGIGTFTKNESVGSAIKETLRQINLIRDSLVTATELSDAKAYYSGSYPLRFETPGQIANQLTSIEFYQLGREYIVKYRDNINAVTLPGVKSSADKYLDPNNFVIVVVGKKDEVLSQLQEFGIVEVKVIE